MADTQTSTKSDKSNLLSQLVGAGLNLAGTIGGGLNQQGIANAQYDAMNNYINGLNQDRTDAKNYMQGNYNTADQQMQGLLNTPLPELSQMKSDITQQATDAQQNNARQMQTQLAQQGVRGGQAGTLAGRQQGQLNRELNYDVNQLGYNEAQNRQNANINYTGQKALLPYGQLNSAQWLYMPSPTEQQLMGQAINNKFGTGVSSMGNIGSALSGFGNIFNPPNQTSK